VNLNSEILNGPRCYTENQPVSVLPGEVAEWLKAHAWKACLGETPTWVRIPPSPPDYLAAFPYV
jgi:hypothetical protein